MTDRYTGKPFLKLIDSYVLDCIGGLDAASEVALAAMEPKLHAIYGGSGDWREMVAGEMEFPPSLPDQIRAIWVGGHDAFVAETGHEPDPVEFTRTFVDTNFAS